MATWNIRTLLDNNPDRPQRRTALVAIELRRYDVDIAALSETRLLYEGSLTEEGQGYTFLWKGYPTGGPHHHGVGLAIKNSLLSSLTQTPIDISERLMSVCIPLAKQRYATFLSAYAPTLPSKNEAKDRFYQELDKALQNTFLTINIFLCSFF